MEILFATSSKNKLEEARALLGFKIKNESIELDEIQSVSVEDVARHKVIEAYRILRRPVIVEDTGLHVEGFNGFPGAMVKWFINGFGYEGICRAVDLCASRRAYAETCVAFYDGDMVRTFVGRARGEIALHPRGVRKFGWDYVFVPNGSKKTFAEMKMSEKNRISQRGKAFMKLKHFLKGNGFI